MRTRVLVFDHVSHQWTDAMQLDFPNGDLVYVEFPNENGEYPRNANREYVYIGDVRNVAYRLRIGN